MACSVQAFRFLLEFPKKLSYMPSQKTNDTITEKIHFSSFLPLPSPPLQHCPSLHHLFLISLCPFLCLPLQKLLVRTYSVRITRLGPEYGILRPSECWVAFPIEASRSAESWLYSKEIQWVSAKLMIITLQTQSLEISWKTNPGFALCPSSVILTLKYRHLYLRKS